MSTPSTSTAAATAAPAPVAPAAAPAPVAPAAAPAPAAPALAAAPPAPSSSVSSGSSTSPTSAEFLPALSETSACNLVMEDFENRMLELMKNPPSSPEEEDRELEKMEKEGIEIWERCKDRVIHPKNGMSPFFAFIGAFKNNKPISVKKLRLIIGIYEQTHKTFWGTRSGLGAEPNPTKTPALSQTPTPAPTTARPAPVPTGKKGKKRVSEEFVTSEQDDTDYETKKKPVSKSKGEDEGEEREESEEAAERRKRKGKGKEKEKGVGKDEGKEKKRKRKQKVVEAEEESEAGTGKGKGKEKKEHVDGPALPPAKKIKREESVRRLPATPAPTSKKRKAQENAEAGPSGVKKQKTDEVVDWAIEAIMKRVKTRAPSVLEVEGPAVQGKPEDWVKSEVTCNPCVKAGKPCKIPVSARKGASCAECRSGKKRCPLVAGSRGGFNLTTPLPVELLEELEEAAGTRGVNVGVASGKADVPTNYAGLLVGLFTRMGHLVEANARMENELRQIKAQNDTLLQSQGGPSTSTKYAEQGVLAADQRVPGAISVGTDVPMLPPTEPTVPPGVRDPDSPESFHMSKWVNDSSVPPRGSAELPVSQSATPAADPNAPPASPSPTPAADPNDPPPTRSPTPAGGPATPAPVEEQRRDESPLSPLPDERKSRNGSPTDEEDGPSGAPASRPTTRSQHPPPPASSPTIRRSGRNAGSKRVK